MQQQKIDRGNTEEINIPKLDLEEMSEDFLCAQAGGYDDATSMASLLYYHFEGPVKKEEYDILELIERINNIPEPDYDLEKF